MAVSPGFVSFLTDRSNPIPRTSCGWPFEKIRHVAVPLYSSHTSQLAARGGGDMAVQREPQARGLESPDLLNTEEAAIFLRVSFRTLELYRSLRKGPAFRRVGRRVYYARQDLLAFLDACRVDTVLR